MDAVEFLKEYRRMCKKYAYMEASGEDCSSECPFYGEHCNLVYDDIKASDAVAKVEQWSQSHPRKTIMQDFFEKFPNAPKNKNSEPMTCPYNCGYGNFCCEQVSGICYDCWSRPLED